MDKIDIEMLVRRHLQELGVGVGSSEKKEYIVAANWKMNMTEKETRKFLTELKSTEIPENIRVMIFPPYPYLYIMKEMLRYERIAYGAQDVAKEEQGAYTGEVSAGMLGDMGCPVTLVGHSELLWRYPGDYRKEGKSCAGTSDHTHALYWRDP